MWESVIGVRPNGGCTPWKSRPVLPVALENLPDGRDFTAQVSAADAVGAVATDSGGEDELR